MKFAPIPCHELLRPFIRNYWVLEATCTAPGTQRVYSNGAVSLHFYLTQPAHLDSDEREYRTSLNRHDLTVMDVHTTKGEFNIFGVEFVPFGTRAFWNISQFKTQHITPQDLQDDEFIAVSQMIHSAQTTDERRQLLDTFFCNRIESKIAGGMNMHRLENVFESIEETDHTSDMAANACLSSKQFTRVFNEYVGINPKSYQRLLRFHKAMMLLREGNNAFTDIAYDCGYTDLAHMTKDIQQLCGKTPTEIVAMGDKLTETFQGKFSNLMKKKIEVENLI